MQLVTYLFRAYVEFNLSYIGKDVLLGAVIFSSCQFSALAWDYIGYTITHRCTA